MNLLENTIIQVALPVPLRKTFEYLPPENSEIALKVGQRVVVPFGRQTLVGIVHKVTNESEHPIAKLKMALSIVEDAPSFDSHQLAFLDWSAKYFQHPIGEVYSSALPGVLREPKSQSEFLQKRLVKTEHLPEKFAANAKKQIQLANLLNDGNYSREEFSEQEVNSTTIKKFVDQHWAQWQILDSSPQLVAEDDINAHLSLNTEQAIAVSAINSAAKHECYLLDGVTGSGKTEVYLQAISHILLQQKQVLVLVPEIGLTPQTISRFKRRFNVPILLWHSGMTDKQRFTTWQQAVSGCAKVIIATRSGVFLPFANLGMIVIDEEHDASFKQQDGFKYHCRSLALYRGKLLDIPVVLGTATPSLETLHNAKTEKFHHLVLQKRATGNLLPKMQLLDLNLCQVDAGIGEPLFARIKQTLDNSQQVMLFINRRGFAPVLMCEECHWLSDCHRCSGFATFHKGSNQLICHHCGYVQPVVHQCPSCGSPRVTSVGVGTEQLHLALAEKLPDYPVVRLDRDSTSKKGEFDRLLEEINKGEPQIIVGTQMIAKGHHFPNVTLVGIVDVDGALFSSDFRAAEKLAQLVVQISGRAGRGTEKGEVWLQTKFPEHPVIQDLVNNQYTDFAKYALTERQMLQLPPFSFQFALRAEATQNQYAADWLNSVSQHLHQFEHLLVLGPSPAPMMRKAGKYRHILTVQCQSRPYLHNVLNWLIENLDRIEKDNRIRWSIDVDPIDLS